MARHEGGVRQGEGTARLEPAAVRVDGGAGQSPGPVGAEPVLGTLSGTLLPAPGKQQVNPGAQHQGGPG